MDIEIIRRIALARHLFGLGNSFLRSDNSLYWFSAVNLLQDAVEAFLLSISDFVKADIDSNTKFDKYFVNINAKISPRELPFKSSLLRLNRIRIDSKHYGIEPSKDECVRLSIAVREFFEETSNSILGANFSTISTLDLLKEGEVKNLLIEAKDTLSKGDLTKCIVNCRKALYVLFEQNYDIGVFATGANVNMLLSSLCRAPFHTKNKEYIDKSVKEPTDFIVLDHSDLDQELLKYAIDNTSFWNVWRLTPEVYKMKDGNWIVKNEFDKLDPEALKDNTEYIFSATTDIVLAIHAKREAIKSRDHRNFYVELKQDKVPIYEKADDISRITDVTPEGVLRIDSDYSIEGLRGDRIYWHVSHLEGELFLYGFISNIYIK